MERYSRLAPFTLEQRRNVTLAALVFFSPLNYRKSCEFVGKTSDARAIRPVAAHDFVKYLSITGVLRDADRFQQRIRSLLDRLVGADILAKMGYNGDAAGA
jgi:hypothetical protein